MEDRYFTTEKAVGETPLQALIRERRLRGIPLSVPLAYAGRLDPMASGRLLILMGEECKEQEKYHALDKEYRVELLLGVSSDTGDVLGHVKSCERALVGEAEARSVLASLTGPIELPYPHFSAKTVAGKPLHTWTLEGRLHEIEVPVKRSTIYRMHLGGLRDIDKEELLFTARMKVDSIPEVTEPRKALGQNFRRDLVHRSWNEIEAHGRSQFQVLSFSCVVSSGTYMRSLGEHIAEKLGTCALALSIYRTTIGAYRPLPFGLGYWRKRF